MSYFTAVNENVPNCDVCKDAVRFCGNTTNMYIHKKTQEREPGAAREKVGGGSGGTFLSMQTHNTETQFTVFSERQGIFRYIVVKLI